MIELSYHILPTIANPSIPHRNPQSSICNRAIFNVTPAVRCRGLVKRFADVVAVAGLDLEVRRGECFGLLGPQRRRQDDDHRDPRGPHAGRCRRGRGARRALGPGTRSRAARAARHPAPGNAAQRQAVGRGDGPAVPIVLPTAAATVDEVLGAGRARDEAPQLGRQAVGRPEAAAGAGLRAGRPARPAVSRRAHDGPRSAIAPPAVGPADAVSRRRRHDPADDALHGRSRAAVRSRGHRRSRQGHRARHAARAHRSLGAEHVVEFARGRRRRARRRRRWRRCPAWARRVWSTAPGRWRPRKCTWRCRRCWRTWRPGRGALASSPPTAPRSRTCSSR